MDVKKIVVVVEDQDASRTALQWALHNLLRYGDSVTLLHVYPSTRSRSKKKLRLLRLKGYQLALSFKEICSNFFNTNVEIIVTEGDQEGRRIAALVREIGASTLVLGLHNQSFLYSLAMVHSNFAANFFNCKVLGIRQTAQVKNTTNMIQQTNNSTSLDFSEIEISGLHVPPPIKVPYQICPCPHAIIWGSRNSRSKGKSSSRGFNSS